MLNTGISIKGSLFHYLYPDVQGLGYNPNKHGIKPYANFLEMGVEINIKGIYNFHKNVGITIGTHISYHGLGSRNFSFGVQTGLIF